MLALSVRQPWAWMILHAGKDIENRDWPTKVRGRVLLHAGKICTRRDYEDARDPLWKRAGPIIELPDLAVLPLGGIVGSVEIVDCVQASGSHWFCGPFGFVLRNQRSLPFTPCRGALGFFDVPESAVSGWVAA